MKTDHFEGKSVHEHLKAARAKGALAAAEIHGTEMPGHLSAAADAARDTAVVLMLHWIIFHLSRQCYFLVAAGTFSLESRTKRTPGLGTSRKTSPRHRRRAMGNSAR